VTAAGQDYEPELRLPRRPQLPQPGPDGGGL